MEITDLIKKGRHSFFQVRKKTIYEGAVYHITQRAPGREPLFVEEADYLYMLHCIKKNVERYNYDLFSFVLMSNHLHILIRLNKENLSVAMKELFRIYAIYFNKKYERKGPVFCNPFRASLCLDDSYLLVASVYIHLNPVKAGIVKNAADYRWSSYSLYERADIRSTFVNCRFILDTLSDDINKARKLYREYLTGIQDKITEDLIEDSRGLEKLHHRFMEYKSKIKNREDIQKRGLLSDKELDERIAELKQKKRLKTPQQIEARKFLIQQLTSRGYSREEIAKKLNISRATMWRYL